MNNCHVIRCNDSVECVVIGTEDEAKQELSRRRAEYFEANKWNFDQDFAKYSRICYWNIREVELIDKSEKKDGTR